MPLKMIVHEFCGILMGNKRNVSVNFISTSALYIQFWSQNKAHRYNYQIYTENSGLHGYSIEASH